MYAASRKILIKIATDGGTRTINNVETIHLRNKIPRRNKILFVNDQNDPELGSHIHPRTSFAQLATAAKPYVHPYSTPINRDDGFVVEKKEKIESRKVKNIEQRDEPTRFAVPVEMIKRCFVVTDIRIF